LLSYDRILVTAPWDQAAALGLRIGGIESEPVGELGTEHELGQLVVSVESSPAFLRGLDRRVGEVEPLREQMDAQYALEPDRRMEFSERTA
jgi:hypothetical protein